MIVKEYSSRGCIVVGLAFYLATFPVFADVHSDALEAMEGGNYTVALQSWHELASDGDAVAQYNLGILYRRGLGVIRDDIQAKYWFTAAARQGLVQAYNQILTNTIQPAGDIRPVVKKAWDPQKWVANLENSYYTLQLASSTNLKLIQKYLSENELQGTAGYYKSKRQGEYWYALVYGAYPSVDEANIAIATLPKDLRKWSPWVRNVKSIHKLTVP